MEAPLLYLLLTSQAFSHRHVAAPDWRPPAWPCRVNNPEGLARVPSEDLNIACSGAWVGLLS